MVKLPTKGSKRWFLKTHVSQAVKRLKIIKQWVINQLMPFATFASLVATVVYAAISVVQLRAMNQANKLNAAQYISSQRPYISFKVDLSHPIPNYLPEESVLNLPITITDNGNTWPKNLVFRTWCVVARGNFNPALYPNEANVYKNQFVPPKETINAYVCSISSNNVQAVEAGQGQIFLAARADYADIINPSDHFVTEFCEKIIGLQGDPTKPNPSFYFADAPCQVYNCADNECETP